MALLADGFHMATHAGALSVAAVAYSYAKRHAFDRRFSFGTGKVGDLAGFASALILGLVALGIGIESVLRLYQPIRVAFGEATVIAIVGLGVNIVSAFLLSGDRKSTRSELQSLMRISYAVFCLKKKKTTSMKLHTVDNN